MKIIFSLFILTLFHSSLLFSQIAVSNDGSQPDNSAMLEVKSTDRGLLLPRMTNTQMNAIPSPAAGLMVFNTTLNLLYWFNGTSWDMGGNRDGKSCGTVTYGGKTYNSVIIGVQCWMTENLNIGTAIPGSQNQADNGVIEKYCAYDNQPNCDTYGGVYQWSEMMNYTGSSTSNPSGRQGICPSGWHVPSDAEFCQVESYLDATVLCGSTGWRGTDGGGKMKETGNGYWTIPNAGATNASGFKALPGGDRGSSGSFYDLRYYAYFWSATGTKTGNAWYRAMSFDNAQVDRHALSENYGFSIRCCKD
ncbi:MAG: FISUMP domain-containing protein [Bacteroidota bacterium]